uniref:Cysteine-rich protein 2 n=1 Tax=Corvus moneduloides TaxID=1196302 RepID=A0A8C3DY43_CORMO
MATERNGAGSRGMPALEPGSELGGAGTGCPVPRGVGDARAPLGRLARDRHPPLMSQGRLLAGLSRRGSRPVPLGPVKTHKSRRSTTTCLLWRFFPRQGNREHSRPDFNLWGWETGQGEFSPRPGPGTCCAGLEPGRTEPGRRWAGSPAPAPPGRGRRGPGGAGRTARHITARLGTAQHGSARLRSPAMASKCPKCDKTVYFAEKVSSLGKDWHKFCLKCERCNKTLTPGGHAEHDGKPFCHKPCYATLFGPKGVNIGGAGSYIYDKPQIEGQTAPGPIEHPVKVEERKVNAAPPKGPSKASSVTTFTGEPNMCPRCGKRVYFAEKVTSLGKDWHRPCLRCERCSKTLTPGGHAEHDGQPYCHKPCYGILFGPKGVNTGAVGSYIYDKDPEAKNQP